MKRHGYSLVFGCTLSLACAPGLTSLGVLPPSYPVYGRTATHPTVVINIATPPVISRVQQAWTARQVEALSNHVAALDISLHGDLGELRGRLDQLEDGRRLMVMDIEGLRAEEHQRFAMLSSEFLNIKGCVDGVREDYDCLSSRVDDTSRELMRSDACLADDIEWLDRAVICLVAGLTAMAVIVFCRTRGGKRKTGYGDGVISTPVPEPLPAPVRPTSPPLPVADPQKAQQCPILEWGVVEDADTLLLRLQALAGGNGGPVCTALDGRTAAVATTKGHVSTENQDYCLGFEIGGVTVELVGDGCGGSPHGAFASFVAVREAAFFIVRAMGRGNRQDIVPLARQALFHAATMMEKYAASAEPPVVYGFRTTLIVILADASRYAFAYAGDGGGMVVRRNGSVERFLFPQKAYLDVQNVLATSLGPVLEGEPASGAIPRYPQDVLLIGSDGIWDYVGPKFPLAVVQALAKAGGNARLAANTVIRDLADFTDNRGYVCTDNLTIGIITDPASATVPPGESEAPSS